MEEDGEETQQSTIDNYTGVSIKVHFCQLIARRPTDVFSRCRSTQKLTKGCGYNSFREDRNLSSLLLLVRRLLICLQTVEADARHPVFAIQKCDPAPFYLFDEVSYCAPPTLPHLMLDVTF